MTMKVTCPECEAVCTVPDARAGKKVRCKQCQAVIEVPAPARTDADADEKPAPARKSATDKKARSKARDMPKKKSGAPILLIVLGGLFLGLLVCAGAGIGGYYLFFTATPVKDVNKDGTKGTVTAIATRSEPRPPVEIKTSVPGDSAGLVISPDARLALVMGLGGTKKNVELWDLRNKAKVRDFDGARHAVGLAIAADGKQAAFSDARGAATLIDVVSGKETELQIKPIPLVPLRAYLRFSPDGEMLYYAADKRIRAWDSKGKERVVWTSPGDFESMTAFFDDGKKIATGDTRGGICVWEVGNPSPAKTLKHKGNNPIDCVVSADGKTLLSVTRMGRDLMVWDLPTGSQRSVNLTEPTPVKSSPVLTPDGKTLIYATLNKHSIVLVNIATGRPDYELKGHTQEITALTLSADGSTLVSLGKDNTLNIWDIKDPK